MCGGDQEQVGQFTRLGFDIAQDTKSNRRLVEILSILLECTEASKFSYHNHAEDKVFESIVFAQPWNMLNLVKLGLYGVSPRAKEGNPSSPGPRELASGIRRSQRLLLQRSFMRGRAQVRRALLDHVKNLPMLSEVVVTEAVYRKLLTRSFLEYEDNFGADKLVKMYRISYSGTEGHQLGLEDWSEAIYYHGTGHCGCLSVHENEDKYTDDREVNQDLGSVMDDKTPLLIEEEDEEDGEDEDQDQDQDTVMNDETPLLIDAKEWCGNGRCPTRGILNQEHQQKYIHSTRR
ncbi:hypothetical protein BGX23_000063 [Mortierella sp. AD031]|nr:hypothetical protein BGX23_000063 [Mortierella sp. AD031]